MWYKDWFKDANYLVVYEHRDEEEAEQLRDLIERVTGSDHTRRILDLASGSGRHAIAFAERGYENVTGIDLSPTLLDEARSSAEAAKLEIRFLERDMRDIPEERFDLVTNLFTSFGYFITDEENAEVIRSVAERLTPGGWFVLDFFNSEWVRTHLVSHDERILPGGKRLEQFRWIENGRVEKRILIRDFVEAHEYVESVRLFSLSDFERMFEAAGLQLEHTFGSYGGEAYHPATSHRLILFGRK